MNTDDEVLTRPVDGPTPAPAPPASPEVGDGWRGFVTLAGVAATVVALDQASKWLVIQRLPLGASWPTPPILRLFSFAHVANTGVAFGLFQGRSNAFILLAAMVVLALVVYQRRLPGHKRLIQVALGLQIGGAIGNLIDRVHLGHVTDFMKVGIWPVFNVADSAIVIGVLLMSYELWQEERMQPAVTENGLDEAAPAERPAT